MLLGKVNPLIDTLSVLYAEQDVRQVLSLFDVKSLQQNVSGCKNISMGIFTMTSKGFWSKGLSYISGHSQTPNAILFHFVMLVSISPNITFF